MRNCWGECFVNCLCRCKELKPKIYKKHIIQNSKKKLKNSQNSQRKSKLVNKSGDDISFKRINMLVLENKYFYNYCIVNYVSIVKLEGS